MKIFSWTFFISIRPKPYKPNLGNITFSSPSAKTASEVFPFLKVEVNIIDPGKLMTTTKILISFVQ